MKQLRLSASLSLPLEAVTEKLAWLGRTGSGKTYGAMKLAELMLEAGAQIGAIDPVGIWRALRVPATPGGQSFEVVVFGGLYGDLPLEPTEAAGHLIADLVVDRGLSFVLDVSQCIPSEQQRVVRGFADRFFHRKKSAPSAVHLFMEECQEFIPENPSGDEARTLGVMQRLWKLGRNFGIGGSLISQRPQEIAKKALNMSGTLFAFQMTGPQERKAIRSWVADQGVAVDIEGVLQRLKVGEPHVESPTFLEVSKTVAIAARVTADLSSTPKVGASSVARRPLTPIDLKELTASMAATLEKAKANDPVELKKRVAALERELAAKPAAAPPQVEQVVVNVVSDEQLRRIGDLAQVLAETSERITTAVDYLRADLAKVVRGREHPLPPARPQTIKMEVYGVDASGRRVSPQSISASRTAVQKRTAPTDARVSSPQQRILDALAFLEGIGLAEADKTQLALLSDASPKSSAYANNLGALRSAGLIEYPSGGVVQLTAEGRGLAAPADVPRDSDDLQNRLFAKLPAPQVRILEALVDVYPNRLAKADLADRADASVSSSAFANNLGALRSLGLIDYPAGGFVVAKPVLFLEAGR